MPGQPRSDLWLLVSTWFQGLFHPPRGVLFTFPSRYWFTIGRSMCLALEGGPPCFPQAYTWLVVLRIPACRRAGALPDSHLLRSRFPTRSNAALRHTAGPTTPVPLARGGFGLVPVRSPLLRESRLISSRRATEMFQFTRYPPSLSCFHERRSPDMTLEGLPH